MTSKTKTYRDIGKEEGLDGRQLERYCAYMQSRFPQVEALKCDCGDAQEWAVRFMMGTEYDYSDTRGEEILKEIDR